MKQKSVTNTASGGSILQEGDGTYLLDGSGHRVAKEVLVDDVYHIEVLDQERYDRWIAE